MDTFLARQPIFNTNRKVFAYELLYRNAASKSEASITDGNAATKSVLSDAITLFGLSHLTNSKIAFINFTEELIMDDFALLAKPNEIVIEILEDVAITDKLIEKIQALKKMGYIIALDDYTGSPAFAKVMPFIDILKVDFMLTSKKEQFDIAKDPKNEHLTLLAEKVETNEEFEWAKSLGYHLFQGYFFSKPTTFQKKAPHAQNLSCTSLLGELQKEEVDFDVCADIVRKDAVLTYQILKRMSTMQYYRGNSVVNIKQALVLMGIAELEKLVFLMLARESTVSESDELIREAYLRGVFAETLMKHTNMASQSNNGFILGMFSMLEYIFGEDMEKLLTDINLPKPLIDALLSREENEFSQFLNFITSYELQGFNNAEFPDIGLTIYESEIPRLYAESICKTDKDLMPASKDNSVTEANINMD